jgi:hypothetical protein
MKKFTLILSALLFVMTVKAQSNKEEIDIMQAAFGMDKKAMVAEFVQVDATQKDAFWKLYDEYETTRKELGKQRIDLLERYANSYDKLTNESADAFAKEMQSLAKKTDQLIVSYYTKIKKVTNPVVALQFYQVENFILTGIRNKILGDAPLPVKK